MIEMSKIFRTQFYFPWS